MFFPLEIKAILQLLLFEAIKHRITYMSVNWCVVLKAHFYHPIDDSLEEKAKAYKEAYRAWLNIEASFHFHDQQGWEDRLGSKEDLQKAMEITKNTLEMAVSKLNNSEIQLAINKGLISNQESEYLLNSQTVNEKVSILYARKREINEIRNNNSDKHSKDKNLNKFSK
ncbi:hypothetical protein [Pseudoalteromonas maricaloris]|uniref:hypothetical protein n=1 Tax=Pseudoalteromonas maricaloris TaxID=184924 RepID=UPI003C152287